MCGFVSLFSREPGGIDRASLLAMRDTIAHRGPDDAGIYTNEHVGLAHRRLSIIDLSTGHQPMFDESGQLAVVYNGEIYNYRELRADLISRGHRFRTKCDTEVLLALYREKGEEFAQYLNGIFALALWDEPRQRLVLVRDRVGVKPLYLWRGDGLLAAASEIKALLVHPRVAREVNEEAVAEYLAFRQLAGTSTLFRDIETLGPGETMIVDRERERRQSYWSLPECRDEPDVPADEEAAVERLDELLQDAVRVQLMSDVPLGTYNSGGVDSSLVTSYVAQLRRDDRLNTFCVGLPQKHLDERPYADLVAERYQTRHHPMLLEGQEFADSLPAVVWHHDEPLNHPNTVAMFLLSEYTKKRVTVVLTGEGCDEFFAGYPRYRLGALLQRLGPVGRALVAPGARLLPPVGGSRGRKLRSALVEGPLSAVAEASRYVPDCTLQSVLDGDFCALTAERRPPRLLRNNLVSSMLEQDQRHYLLSVLNRLDKASMAFSVEARVPFLDHRILEFAAGVAPSLKLHRGQTKYVVKKLAARRLPHEIVYRKKSGLSLPLGSWFREESGMGRYVAMLREPRSLERPYLSKRKLRRAIERFHGGGALSHDLLWGLVNLELWQRVMVEPRQISCPPKASAAA